MFREEVEKHLRDSLIPFWKGLKDDKYGGYYGYADFDLNVDREAEKGCILNSRILWFFSTCATLLEDKSCLAYADHAYEFLKKYFADTEKGGLFWSVDYKGEPLDTTKHTYCQAFAIYGLSAYYEAGGNIESLDTAGALIDLIEERCRDKDGYLEAFARDFSPAVNDKLSENGVIAERTMNTLLHVFEAYTEYYRVTEGISEAETASRRQNVALHMKEQLTVFKDKMYNPAKHRQEVFFDRDYHTLLDLISYGHDIETAWLIDRGLEVLGDAEIAKALAPMTSDLADNILNTAFDGHSLPMECEDGTVNEKRIWWVQAETVNGFMNEYQKDGSKKAYKDAVLAEWEYIKANVLYKEKAGEWYSELYEDGRPDEKMPAVSPWKCPYHNGRMCLEVIRRKIDY